MFMQVWPAQPSSDGAGVKIMRNHGFNGNQLDPFLMIDEIRSAQADDYIAGFPPHPHRGFETLTIMRQGSFSHSDSMGNQGTIAEGGAQWMSAGRGVIHSEMPAQQQGAMHGFQLWINLPAKDKLKQPEYRDISAAEIPTWQHAGVNWRQIAGQSELSVHQGAATVVTGAQVLPAEAAVADVTLHNVSLALRTQDTTILRVYQGTLNVTVIDDSNASAAEREQQVQVKANQLLLLKGWAGRRITVAAGDADVGFLVLQGEPIAEPMAHYGPFVMNSTAEIEQAIRDYQQGALAAAPKLL